MPSFVDMWGFTTASQDLDPSTLSVAEVDHRISARLSKGLKSYDGLSHQALFTLPKHIRQELAAETRIITDDNPIFVY